MLNDYLIVHKSILPDFFDSVLKAKALLEDGKVSNVTEAVKIVGISRSTYYKYKDYIVEMSDFSDGRKAVLSMMLSHEPGILSKVLMTLSELGGSILSINQSLPIHDKASVTISLDISDFKEDLDGLLKILNKCNGVENPRILAVE